MTELEARIEATTRLLMASAREAQAFITGDGRVTEEVAAQLLGYAPKTLASRRGEGKAPEHFNHGRITYRVSELARFIEAGRLG